MANDNPYLDLVQAPPAPANPYLNVIQDHAAQAVTGVSAIPPQQGADAVSASRESGLPTSATLPDPGAVKGMVDTRRATAISNTNPAMARWSLSDPAHVAASQDQYPWLDGFSRVWSALKTYAFPGPRAATNPWEEIKNEFHEDVSSAEQSLKEVNPTGLLLGPIPGLPTDVGTLKAASAATAAGFSWLTGGLTGSVGQLAESTTGLNRNITGTLLSMLVPLGGKAASKRRPMGLPGGEFHAPPYEGGPTIEGTFTEEGKAPHPAEEVATNNAEVMDAMHSAVQAQPLLLRSPQTMEEFIGQQTADSAAGTINISANKIVEAYENAGTAPHPKDGILGWMPDIDSRLAAAHASGGDVAVPTAGYLTNVSDEGHASMRDGISFAEAPSVDEAKNLKAPLEETQAPENSDVPEEAKPEIAAAVKKVREEQYLSPLFKDAASAGMTEGQFALYSKNVEAADNALYEHLHGLATKQITREAKADWLAKSEELGPVARAFIAARPGIAVRHFLSTGEDLSGRGLTGVKLDKRSVARDYPNLIGDLPSSIFGANGVGADDVSEAFGFRNGESMLHAIVDSERVRATSSTISGKEISIPEHFRQLVKNETRRRVADELGDLLSPENIAREATMATQRPEVQRLLTDQLKALAKAAGLPFDKDAVAKLAEDQFGQLNAADATKVKSFERLIGRNGREAEVALLKKKYPEAFLAKQRQLVNNKLLALSHDFRKEFLLAAKQYKSWTKLTTSKTMPQEYLNYIHAAFADMGMKVSRDADELVSALGGKSLNDFANEKYANGYDIVTTPIQPSVMPQDMIVNQFRAVHDMLNSLAANGRNEQTIITHNGRMELEDAVTRAKDQFEDRLDKYSLDELINKDDKGAKRLVISGRNALHALDAPLRSIEFLLDNLDNNALKGVFNEVVYRPLYDGLDHQAVMEKTVADSHKTFSQKVSKDFDKGLAKRIEHQLNFVDLHGDEINPMPTVKNLLNAALYYGSDSGRAKLLEGYGWEENQFKELMDTHLNEEHIAFLEHMWKTYEDMWPEIEAFTRRVSGVAPPKIKAEPFSVNGRLVKGGYIPVVYDKALTPFTGKNAPGAGGESSLISKLYHRATPPRGYTIARTGYSGPLNLSPEILASRTHQIIHDISLREPLMSAERFLTHKEVSPIIRKSLGTAYYKQLYPWMQRLAGSHDVNMSEYQGWTNIMDGARSAAVAADLMFHASTIAIHGTTAAAKSVVEVGGKNLSKAAVDFFTHPEEMTKFIKDRSEFMNRRKVDRDQSLDEQYKGIIAKRGKVDQAVKFTQKAGYKLLGYSDWGSAAPTWLAKYRELMASDKIDNEADAIYGADKAVRKAHGSGESIDLPALLNPKGGMFAPLLKSFTPFMTSRLNSYNRLRDVKNKAGLLAAAVSLALVPGVVEALLHPEKKSFMRRLGENSAASVAGYVPILGELIYAIKREDSAHLSIFDEIVQNAIIQPGIDINKALHGKPVKKAIQHTLAALSYLTGGITGALSRPVQYWWDVDHGHEHPHGIADAIRGTLFGPKPKGQ